MKKTNQLTPKQTLVQIIKFIGFSCTAGIIQVVAFTVLTEVFHIAYWSSYLTALVLSVLYNFTINRKFTFKATSNVPVAMLKIFAYYCVFTPVSIVAGNYLTDVLMWNAYVVLAISMISNMATEYLVYRLFVYNE